MTNHPDLAAGRWQQLTLVAQMANIGSEVNRAIGWKRKGQDGYAERASDRALELFDLTLDSPLNRQRLKEVARAREFWTDYFFGENLYGFSEKYWQDYFLQFACAARRET